MNKPISQLTTNDFVGLYRSPRKGKMLFQLEITSLGTFVMRGTDDLEIDKGTIEFVFDVEKKELFAILKQSLKVKITNIDNDGFYIIFPIENEFQTLPPSLNFFKTNEGKIYITRVVYAPL